MNVRELTAYLTNVDTPKLVEPLVKWSHEPARPQEAPSPCRRRSCWPPPPRLDRSRSASAASPTPDWSGTP
jgi:hypothetical protein